MLGFSLTIRALRISTPKLRTLAAILTLIGLAQMPVATARAHDLAVYAFGLVGASYRFGGESPDDGLDCSGLVRHVFQQVTGVTLPRTSKDLSRIGGSVKRTELEPGDLVFFNTRRFAFSHVGIYVGDNRFVHAPRRGREVEIADLQSSYWKGRFDGARRLVGAAPALFVGQD